MDNAMRTYSVLILIHIKKKILTAMTLETTPKFDKLLPDLFKLPHVSFAIFHISELLYCRRY